jgi:hypothetical protein
MKVYGNKIDFEIKTIGTKIKIKNINAPGRNRINPLPKDVQSDIVNVILKYMNQYMPNLKANVRVE